MVNYIGEKDYEHGSKEKTGILLTNLKFTEGGVAKNKFLIFLFFNIFL